MRTLRRVLLGALICTSIVMMSGSRAHARFAGTISGNITDANTSAPIAGITVFVVDSNGNPVSGVIGTTDGSGHYSTLGSLTDGTYYVSTSNQIHYINEAGGGTQCAFSCNLTLTAPVQVTSGVGTMDFQLALGGTISGTVRNESAMGLQSVFVEIVDAGNQFLASVSTDASGAYTTGSGLPSGTYFAKTDVNGSFIPPLSQGYINAVYPNVPCLTAGCPTTGATPLVISGTTTLTGKDFALHAGARFSGTVTDSGTSLGIAGVTVDVLNASNQIVSVGTTDAAGAFETVAGLQAGSYTLRTLGSGGHINKFNDGTVCVGSFCQSITVTPIAVADGALHSGVNFSLDPGAVFSGMITEQGTGNPINAIVSVLGSNGLSITTVQTGFGTGTYTTTDGVPPGTYFLRTTNFDGHIDQIYNGVACNPTCSVNNGTAIAVAAPGTVTGKDFSLAVGGRITGVITNAATSATLSGVTVNVATLSGAVVTSATSQPNGTYITAQGLPPGQYLLRTSNGQGFINEVYPNVPCLGTNCPAGAGTPVAIVGTSNTAADFALSPGGRISGSIFEGVSTPVPGAIANVLDATGVTISTGQASGTGAYITGAGLPSGSYYVRTTNSAGEIDQLYVGVTCGVTCNLAAGSPVGVTLPNTTPGIDFHLALGGQISGTVTTGGSTPLSNITVQIYSPSSTFILQSITDSNGHYLVRGLADGTYYARTTNSLGYINEAYNNIPCVLQCTTTTLGSPLNISGANVISGTDFDLVAGGRVAGMVTDQTSSLPLANVGISIVDASGATVSTATTDLTGHYTTQAGIAAGTYYVRTGNSLGYLNELYNDVLCTGTCTLTTGSTIGVSLGATTPGINFGLVKGGRITGTITDSASSLPLQNVNITAVDAGGRIVGTGVSDAAGQYSIGAGLPTGAYYLRTQNTLGYIDEMYDNKPCPLTCTVTTGTVVNVTSPFTTSGKNFALTPGGRISGQVLDGDSSQPIANVSVQILDSTGRVVSSGSTNSFGFYTTASGMPSGTYYARTSNSQGYINQIFNGHDCVGTCLVSTGDSIAVTGGSTTPDVNFALHAGGRISGNISTSGSKLGVTVQVYDGTGAIVTTATTNSLGDYITTAGLISGTYYARTFNNRGLINQLYSGLPCSGTCTVTAGTGIGVSTGSTTSGVNFTLADGARFSGTVTRTSPSGPLSNVLVEIYDAGNNRVATGVTDSSGNYVTSEGVVSGIHYHARTQNMAGFVNQIYSGINCSASCDASGGTDIVATAPNIATGINFTLTLDPDSDADGIANTIDTQPAVFSNNFDDTNEGGTTDGVIAGRDTWAVKVFDVSPGGVQMQITGSGVGPAAFDTCSGNGSERVLLDVAGEIAQVTCISGPGSTFARAIVASPTIELRDPPTGPGLDVLLTTGQAATIGSPVVASPTNTEAITVDIIGAGGVTIGSFDLDPGESVDVTVHPDNSVAATVLVGTVTITVGDSTVTESQGDPVHNFPPPSLTFTFTGFFSPISNPPVVNKAKAGSAVPITFSLGGDQGLDIFASGSPTSQPIGCSDGALFGSIETIDTPGKSGLEYDPSTQRYTYTWKTVKSWAGTCRQLTVQLKDGSVHTALFQFK